MEKCLSHRQMFFSISPQEDLIWKNPHQADWINQTLIFSVMPTTKTSSGEKPADPSFFHPAFFQQQCAKKIGHASEFWWDPLANACCFWHPPVLPKKAQADSYECAVPLQIQRVFGEFGKFVAHLQAKNGKIKHKWSSFQNQFDHVITWKSHGKP